MNSPLTIWMNGRLADPADARVSVMDHGLLYGDGVFEGIRYFDRRAFRLGAHIERLFRSASALSLAVPYSASELATGVGEVVAKAPSDNGYLRVVATRGEGDLGLDPRSCVRPTVIIIAATLQTFGDAAQSGIDVVVAVTRQAPLDAIDPRIKSLNYLNRILARLEAIRAGASEALMLSAQGRIAEGTTNNLFVVRDRELLTPPATDGALEGITRQAVLGLARVSGIPCREASLAPYDMIACDEAFVTGTAAGLVPIRSVDGRRLPSCPGPVFRNIATAFEHLVRLETGAQI